jgi:hypothetical protein
MLWRGSSQLIAADVVEGFVVIGVLSALPSFAFWRLPADAGESLRQTRTG